MFAFVFEMTHKYFNSLWIFYKASETNYTFVNYIVFVNKCQNVQSPRKLPVQ